MTQEQVIEEIIKCLDCQLHNVMGHISDGQWKIEFFKLFAEAYNTKPITADALRELLITQWFENDDKEKRRLELLDPLMDLWRAWKYAWDHSEMKKK